MNQSSTTTWSPMISGPEEDFANFLEFGDLQLNFPAFDTEAQDAPTEPSPNHGLDTTMETGGGMVGMKGDIQPQIDPNLLPMQASMAEMRALHGSTDSLLDMNMQAQIFHHQQLQYHQQRRMQNLYHSQGMVPPTPSSLEMHGQPRSYPQMDPSAMAVYDHYTRKDHMVFTPLVSPAVTPLDNQFRMPEYTTPGEYFSPLTSPALEAQMRPAHRSVYGPIRGSDTSDTASPIEMDIDQTLNATAPSGPNLRKSKRKSISTSTKSTGRAVKQSPAMKPQTRSKRPTSTVIPPKEVDEVIEDARRATESGQAQPSNGKLSLPCGQDSSEAESVSPEPLSEILMPPPATPRQGSVGRSPYLKAQASGSQSTPQPMRNAPATPASLMKIQKKAVNGTHERRVLEDNTSRAGAEMEQILEGIPLPETITGSKPILSTLNTTNIDNNQTTPTLSAQKVPSSSSTLVFSAVVPSPQTSAVASPGASFASKRGEPKFGGRGSKKRSNTISSQVSPALRPRISPSIKPLLPEGTTINAETSALLLASKSNYQNILEGTHLPGVSYPEALSTNLTSKRTSHKIAEQGRRNRINNALQEIASLLPSSTPQVNGMARTTFGDANPALSNMMSGTAAQQSNSKASTVELAIEYIKSLQTELKDVKGKLELAEQQLGQKTEEQAVKV